MPASLDDFYWTYQSLIDAVGVNGILALSMYVVLAVGQLSLGQAAFMGLGAYAGALATVKFGMPFPVSLAAAALVPALVALAVGKPTLRLTGVYLAIATIGLGEISRLLFLDWDYAGGALGLSGIPERGGFLVIYGLLLALLVGFALVARSRLGRAMEAMREDEAAAGVMGVNVPRYRLAALAVSAMLAGIAGCLSAHVSSFIGPNEYGFEQAVTILSFALPDISLSFEVSCGACRALEVSRDPGSNGRAGVERDQRFLECLVQTMLERARAREDRM